MISQYREQLFPFIHFQNFGFLYRSAENGSLVPRKMKPKDISYAPWGLAAIWVANQILLLLFVYNKVPKKLLFSN